jgi:hypothetical protein
MNMELLDQGFLIIMEEKLSNMPKSIKGMLFLMLHAVEVQVFFRLIKNLEVQEKLSV